MGDKPVKTVIMIGKRILVTRETFFCSYCILIRRFFFVVIRRITGGCMIGTRAI